MITHCARMITGISSPLSARETGDYLPFPPPPSGGVSSEVFHEHTVSDPDGRGSGHRDRMGRHPVRSAGRPRGWRGVVASGAGRGAAGGPVGGQRPSGRGADRRSGSGEAPAGGGASRARGSGDAGGDPSHRGAAALMITAHGARTRTEKAPPDKIRRGLLAGKTPVGDTGIEPVTSSVSRKIWRLRDLRRLGSLALTCCFVGTVRHR